ncbi:MAG: IMP dehydrogenase [Dehalococcoidia bacterium]
MNNKLIDGLSLSFDDVLLLPDYSETVPKDIDVSSRLTQNIRTNIPIVSAAMDTVTESATAISMARAGGLGFIHRNMSIEKQAFEVDKVKKSESGMITDPISISPDAKIKDAQKLMETYKISGIPVVEKEKLVGILTNRDLRFETNFERKVSEVMTKENLVTIEEGVNLSNEKDLERVKALLQQHRIEKLLVVNKKGLLAGLITIKDLEKIKKHPNACKDSQGRLRVGAAIGVGKDCLERAGKLLKVKADVILIDTSHGHSKNVISTVKELKAEFKDIEIVAGNVATEEGALALIEAGISALKVGIGAGSICTTRIIGGVGVPQLTAILKCAKVADQNGIPLIADGGIKYSGDITKAIGAGANIVMLGGLLAGTEESPGETVFLQGRNYKAYRGMGSLEAMKEGSRDRYSQCEDVGSDKLVPEGIVGRVPYRGTISENLFQLVGGLKSGMGYTGCKNIDELRRNAKFARISTAGLKESHVHNVIITKEAPNYQLD